MIMKCQVHVQTGRDLCLLAERGWLAPVPAGSHCLDTPWSAPEDRSTILGHLDVLEYWQGLLNPRERVPVFPPSFPPVYPDGVMRACGQQKAGIGSSPELPTERRATAVYVLTARLQTIAWGAAPRFVCGLLPRAVDISESPISCVRVSTESETDVDREEPTPHLELLLRLSAHRPGVGGVTCMARSVTAAAAEEAELFTSCPVNSPPSTFPSYTPGPPPAPR
ncbi:hypothetical protein ACOMHN_034191 [Nucella lapillus]